MSSTFVAKRRSTAACNGRAAPANHMNRYSRSAKPSSVFSQHTRTGEPPRDSDLERKAAPEASLHCRSRLKRILGPRSIENPTAAQKCSWPHQQALRRGALIRSAAWPCDINTRVIYPQQAHERAEAGNKGTIGSARDVAEYRFPDAHVRESPRTNGGYKPSPHSSGPAVFFFKLRHPLCDFDGSSSTKSSGACWLITRESNIWVTQHAQTRGRHMICLPVPTSA